MKEQILSCTLVLQGYSCQATGDVENGKLKVKHVWIPGDCVLELADLDDEDQQKVITALEAERQKLGPKV